jgi:hypothetical protein
MTRLPVKSSHILSIGHEGDVMEVEYASGQVYRYTGVGDDAFNSMMAGESIGRGLRQAIHQEGVVGTKVVPEVVEVY